MSQWLGGEEKKLFLCFLLLLACPILPNFADNSEFIGWTGKFHTFRKWSILWYILIDLDELSILFDGRSFLTNIFIFFWSYFCNLIKKDTFTVNVSHIPLHVPIFLMKNWTSDRRDLLINIFWFKWTKKDSGYSSFYCVHFKLLLIYFVWRFLFQKLIHLWKQGLLQYCLLTFFGVIDVYTLTLIHR